MQQGVPGSVNIAPLYQAKGWMKFAGIMSIIIGALQVLSIWGIIIAWIPIWLGVLLIQASNLVGQAQETGNEQSMLMSFQKLGTYFKIYGIFMIVMIVVGILAMIAAISIPAFMGMRQAATGGM